MNWCDHDDEANRSRLFGTAPSIATNIDVASKRTLATIPSGDGVVVSHAGSIRVAVSTLLGENLASTFDRSIDFARAAILESNAGRYELMAFNTREPSGTPTISHDRTQNE